MKRTYHGCEIKSTLESKPVKGSDGWSHVVRSSGKVIGKSITLGKAVQIAKKHTPDTKTDTTTVPNGKANK